MGSTNRNLPVFPTGWFRVAFSHEVGPGAMRSVRYFGQDLLVFRDEQGTAHVLDAYCPHLGSHLGRGGRVVDNAIECPFHRWRFNGHGECVAAPYAKKTPSRAQIPRYQTQEVNGQIFAYFSVDRAAPDHLLPELPEAKQLAGGFATIRYTVKTHIQDLRENSADVVHMFAVHRMPEPARVLEWTEEGRHLRFSIELPGALYGLARSCVTEFSYHGLGLGVTHQVVGGFEFIIVGGSTPVDNEHTEVAGLLQITRPRMPGLRYIAQRLLARRFVKELRRDARIWNHKRYLERPVLSSADESIIKFRSWAAQFYPRELPAATELSSQELGVSRARSAYLRSARR